MQHVFKLSVCSFALFTACFLPIPVFAREAAPPGENGLFTYEADADWIPIEFHPCRTVPGSALDFSSYLDAPAGKYGHVVPRGGRFSFEKAPDQTIRFFGLNVTHQAPFLDKQDAETYADCLAALGFNAVRFHLMERWLTVKDGSVEFNPEQKEKFDYLIDALKRRGIYYILIVYSGAYFKPGVVNDIPEYKDKEFRFEMNGLAMVSDDAMNYMRRFARNLLTTKNVHTGLAPKDDPALLAVELTNENPVVMMLQHYKDLIPVFERKCREFLAHRDGKEPTDEEFADFFNRYKLDRQQYFFDTMKDYLRNELGVKSMISDVNNRFNLNLTMVRNSFDYVDVHAYWDLYRYVTAPHSGGGHWKVTSGTPYRLRYLDPIKGHWDQVLQCAVPRIFGKPFACGEFNMCYPAPDRAMAIPLQSSLAALQDWGMLLHCGSGATTKMIITPHAEQRLGLGTSPLFQFSDRIGSRLFAQGDLERSKTAIPLVLTEKYLYDRNRTNDTIRPPAEYARLGWICRIGVTLVRDDSKLPPIVVIPEDMEEIPECVKKVDYYRADKNLLVNLQKHLPDQTPKRKTSTTGQIAIDAQKGLFTVATGKSECILTSADLREGKASRLSVSGDETASTHFLASLDGQTIDRSRRLVYMYLTDLKNTGTIVGKEEKTGFPLIYHQGRLPHLVRQSTVDVAVEHPQAKPPTVWALRYDGSRAVEVPVTKETNGFSFKAQAVSRPDAYWAFELVWE